MPSPPQGPGDPQWMCHVQEIFIFCIREEAHDIFLAHDDDDDEMLLIPEVTQEESKNKLLMLAIF